MKWNCLFSLEKLSKMLATHYDQAPIIIIDEYDTPIQEGHSKDFYDEIIGFMRNFFSGAFKDNKKSFLRLFNRNFENCSRKYF